MPLFKRRGAAPAAGASSSRTDEPGHDEALIDEPTRWAALAALRAANPAVPDISEYVVVMSVPIAPAAAGGPLEGLLDGLIFESWQTSVLAFPYVACVFEPDRSLRHWVVCERASGGDYLMIFTPDGKASRQGPAPDRIVDARAWTEMTFDMTLAVLARQVLAKSGAAVVDTRVRDHAPFHDFAESVPFVPLVASWQVSERIGPSQSSGTVVEIWDSIIDAETSPPNPYRTPLVAAQYAADGAITAMLAIETMPQVHEDVYLIVFDSTGRTNFGVRPDLLDPAAFREVALQILFR